MLLLQDVSSVEKLLRLNDVAVVGVLLAIICILIYFIIKLRKEAELKDEKIASLFEKMIEREKENTQDLLEITNKTATTINQMNEMIKIFNK